MTARQVCACRLDPDYFVHVCMCAGQVCACRLDPDYFVHVCMSARQVCACRLDPDYFVHVCMSARQVCACRLDPDYFVQTVLERFHVSDWLSYQGSEGAGARGGYRLEKEQEVALVEAALQFLTTLLHVRTYLGRGALCPHLPR